MKTDAKKYKSQIHLPLVGWVVAFISLVVGAVFSELNVLLVGLYSAVVATTYNNTYHKQSTGNDQNANPDKKWLYLSLIARASTAMAFVCGMYYCNGAVLIIGLYAAAAAVFSWIRHTDNYTVVEIKKESG